VKTTLYLIRHGEVEARHLFYGQLDVPLSDRGREQAARAAAALAHLPVTAVHSSDLLRAEEGALLAALEHGLEHRADPAFREMNLGLLEGVPHAEIQQRHPQLASKRYADMWSYRFPGGGENMQDLAARCLPRLERILAGNAGGVVLLVAHNSINRIILGRALGLPLPEIFGFAQDFGCINRIDYGDRVRVRLVNWTPDALDRR
jgi:broad specificity phosphatase PhoE